MRLLFVCKRRPQQRDLIDRPYGRFHHLPVALARNGHDVRVLLYSHSGLTREEHEFAGVKWSGRDVRSSGLSPLLHSIVADACAFNPDWIIGCSDTWYGWLAHWLARRTGAYLAVDAYDNYEAYMPWNLPLHWRWRRAVHAADVVTAAGPQLAARLDRHRRNKLPTALVPMAADPNFKPGNRISARMRLGLPIDTPLVGYTGGWARNRGTDVILDTFQLIRAKRPNARLVLSGRPPPHALSEPGVFPLGYVDDAQLPDVLRALDVACVITADTSFGRFSYPAKLCEAMACEVPVVATATDPVKWMLRGQEHLLAPIGDASAIADRVLSQLDSKHIIYPDLPSWEDSARRFETAITSI